MFAFTRRLAPFSAIAKQCLATGRAVRTVPRSYATTKFTRSHEWVKLDGGVATVGITNFAQEQLGDVVYVDLPAVGESFQQGDIFVALESVKAAADVYAPLTGKVTDANGDLSENPALVNESAEADGWMAKIEIEDQSEFDGLLDKAQYEALCEEESDADH